MQEIDVLVVDDDETYLDFVTAVLRFARLAVEAVTSGAEALEILNVYRPEVGLSDVAMPGMSGYELCRKVRERREESEIPFLFSSALDDPPERIAGLRVGADDYIVKSADPEEMLLRIRQQIHRHRRLRFMTEMAERRRLPGLMNGSLRPIAVPELLQVVAYLRLPEVCVSLEKTGQRRGEIFFREGSVVHAKLETLTGGKALLRMLAWTDGTFRVVPRSWTGEATLDEPLEKALFDGLVELDNYRAVHDRVRRRGSRFRVVRSPDLIARSFEEPATRVLALVAAHHDLDEVLDRSPLTDLETIRGIAELLETDAIRPIEEQASQRDPVPVSL
jgi:DNA-binding response OmpR family regulator